MSRGVRVFLWSWVVCTGAATGVSAGNDEFLGRIRETPPGGIPLRFLEILSSDAEDARRVIERAKELGINGVELSGDMVSSAAQVLKDREMESRLRELGRAAHVAGLLVFISTAEPVSIPREYRAPDGEWTSDDRLLAFLQDRYRDLFTLLPDLDGILLTPDGAGGGLGNDKDRTLLLIDWMVRICGEYGKTLIVQAGPDRIDESLRTIEKRETPPDNLGVSIRSATGEWSFFAPNNQAIGKFGSLPVLVEIDLGAENWGENGVPVDSFGEISYRLEYARSEGAKGAVGRLGRTGNPLLGTFGEANLYALARLLKEPETDPRSLLEDWCKQEYGDEAAPLLAAASGRTFPVACFLFFPKSFPVLPDKDGLRAVAAYPGMPPALALHVDENRSPTEGTILSLRAGSGEALNLAQASLAEIDQAKAHLTPEQYEKLRKCFAYERDLIRPISVRHELIFRIRQYDALESKDGDETERARIREEIVQLADRLLAEADWIEKKWGEDVYPAPPRDLRAIVYAPWVRRFRRDLLEKPVYSALSATGEIKIDGDLSEWEEAPPISLDQADQAHYQRVWQGVEDASAMVRFAWTPKSLYVAAIVRDSTYRVVLNEKGDLAGDSLTIGLDLRGNGSEFAWDEDDVVLRMILYEGSPILQVVHGHIPALPASSEIAIVRNDGETSYETRFDWKGYLGISPGEMGMSVMITDGDLTDSDGYLEWTPGLADPDAASWGRLKL